MIPVVDINDIHTSTMHVFFYFIVSAMLHFCIASLNYYFVLIEGRGTQSLLSGCSVLAFEIVFTPHLLKNSIEHRSMSHVALSVSNGIARVRRFRPTNTSL